MARRRDNNSMETILNFDNRDAQSQWSTVWSTTHVPGMDNATGGGVRSRVQGRARLRTGSLTLGMLLCMHSRVPASAVSTGVFLFMLFLIVAVLALANPLRHFEVYLGQWSINGPGRAFRIVPIFDGIGIAMCLNALFRAMNSCTVAAMAATYMWHTIRDVKLPFKYCRDFNLNPYDPTTRSMKYHDFQEHGLLLESDIDDDYEPRTVGLLDEAWRNFSSLQRFPLARSQKIAVCNEVYNGPYPGIYKTPPYNFFYVEVVQFRSNLSLRKYNFLLMGLLLGVWLIIWLSIISERITYGKLIWNNMPTWVLFVPCFWLTFLIYAGASNVPSGRTVSSLFMFGDRDILSGMADAFEVAMYIHSASIGTELITGKGLNRFASGHIDPALNRENVLHSLVLLCVTALHSGGVALCSLVDSTDSTYRIKEGTLWILPMYSKCTAKGELSHFISTCVFLGLFFSHVIVALVLVKSALHTIFEYRVTLVFREQLVVAALILSCSSVNLLYTSNGGVAILESVDALMTGLASPFICMIELIALLYVYRSRDFTSDLNVSMEESACAPRVGIQWQIIPFISLVVLVTKIVTLFDAEMPPKSLYLALVPLTCVIISIPLHGIHNAYTFLHSPRAANRNA